MAMKKEGTSEQDARDKIWMVDSKGLIVKDRPEGGVTGHKVHYAKKHAPIKNLADVVKKVKPSILIGKSIGVYFCTESKRIQIQLIHSDKNLDSFVFFLLHFS